MKRALAAASAVALGAAALAGCGTGSTVSRPGQPLVLEGTDLPDLVGEAPGDIVAFRMSRPGGEATWIQIPVQVDQRKVVPFGSQPSNNTTAGVDGTVYGSGSGGPTALQYADPGTFVGADTDPTFDGNDELVVMISDAGGPRQGGDPTEPAGVDAGSGVAVRIGDPQDPSAEGWVYLFTSSTLDPAAGKDYVDYDFNLTSGAYKTTYKRADGPNPETSRVVTDAYEIDYTDRWYETAWRISAGEASGVDVLDGHKNQFAIGNCGRSNATFADAEGAFVANIDGPIRGIRSYIGANSGPLTQRTHLMYAEQEVVITDLRVHAIPAMLDLVDLSSAGIGMTYRSSTAPGGVTVDGTNDAVPTGQADWEAWEGPQGLVVSSNVMSTSATVPGSWYYRDESPASATQCWGDAAVLGMAGPSLGAIPNTDPRSTPFDTLSGTRTLRFLAPAADDSLVAPLAAALAADDTQPVTVTVSPDGA
jgi:hypothetical protein